METSPAVDVRGVPRRVPAAYEGKTREEIRDEIKAAAWYQDLQTPKLGPGDPAADFALPVLDANHGLTSQIVRLSDYAGQKPVALIFGSYT